MKSWAILDEYINKVTWADEYSLLKICINKNQNASHYVSRALDFEYGPEKIKARDLGFRKSKPPIPAEIVLPYAFHAAYEKPNKPEWSN